MSGLPRFTIQLVAVALLVLGLGIATSLNKPGFIVFVMFALLPIAWTLWIVCVIRQKKEEKVWPLFLLWVLTDLAVLLQNRLAFGNFYGSDSKGGSELVWLVEFSPPILPIIPIAMIPGSGEGISKFVRILSDVILPVAARGVLRDWAEFSILAAFTSFAFVMIRINWGTITKRIRFMA